MAQENQNEEKVEKKCKFTILMVMVIISLLLSISALTLSVLSFKGGAGASQAGPVVISKQYDKGRSLDKAIATKKPMVVFFYTDWCGFCQRFIKTFDKVTKDRKIKSNFAIAYVNCEDQNNHKYMEEYKVQGFPTVFVVAKDGKKVHLDNNTFFNDDSVEVIKNNILDTIEEE